MKKILLLAFGLATIFSSCQNLGTIKPEASTAQEDSVAMYIGYLNGFQISLIDNVNMNGDAFIKGFTKGFTTAKNSLVEADGLSSSDSTVKAKATEAKFKIDSTNQAMMKEANEYLQNYMTVVIPARAKKVETDYIAEIEKNKNITKTESGLLYEIIESGDTSNMPAVEDTVEVHYRGTKTNGEEFDSSYSRNQTAKFALTQVIQGWTEGLRLIGKGGKIKLYIPSELGYGNEPRLGNQVLVFDIELIDINKATPAEQK